MKKLLAALMIPLFLFVVTPCWAEDICLDREDLVEFKTTIDSLDAVAKEYEDLLETLKTKKPEVIVTDQMQIIITEQGQVFTDDDIELNFSLSDEAGKIYDYDLNIDLNTEIIMEDQSPSWWDENKFEVGFVIGGLTVTVVIGGLAYLLK